MKKKTKKIKPSQILKSKTWKGKLKKPVRVIKKAKPIPPEAPFHKTKIKVIGIGGGGSSIISEIAPKVKKVSFVAANTDLRALKELSKKVNRFQFGQSLTQGLGTGMNTEIGREAAQNEKEGIKKILKGQDLCILVASLGGGTGSGASPIFAKISKDLGVITYGIFTLPFKFEGEKKMEIAKDSLEKLRLNLNALSIIPNERIFQIIDKKTPLKVALSAINKNLSEALEGLIEMIYLPGLINIDLADLKTILEKRGKIAYLNTIEVQGEKRAEEAIKKLISSPLYPYTIRGAKGILFNIEGEKNLGLAEVGQISKTIHDLVNKEAKIIFGISQSNKNQNKIKITLLATGCGTRLFPKIKPPHPLIKKPHFKKVITKKKPIEEKPKKKRKIKRKIKLRKAKVKPKKIKESSAIQPEAKFKKEAKSVSAEEKAEVKIRLQPSLRPPAEGGPPRKNALQIKKETEKEEEELIAKEKEWEFPAFLRKKQTK